MKREMAEMRQELRTLKAQKSAPPAAAPLNTSAGALAALNKKVDDLTSIAELNRPGENKFLLTGSASGSFTAARNEASNFSATFSPIFLWHINDRLLFESEVEFELEGHDTVTKLEYAQLSYLLNDYMTVGVGKFLNPMNIFVERYESKWINKLPDTPLAIYDGILPESNVGMQIRGVIPAGPTRFNYALYVSNAPSLITDDPESAGQLEFDNFSSVSDNKAFGGRVGFMPCANFEIGYGIQGSQVQGDQGPSVRALLQSVDLTTYYDSAALKGRFTLQGQYAWSDVGNMTYDPNGDAGFGPLNFSNQRNGGYVQLSYRPKRFETDFINKLEFIARADRLKTPAQAPGGGEEKRLTFGIDYWLTSSTALKAAYEFDRHDNGASNNDAIILQVATGF